MSIFAFFAVFRGAVMALLHDLPHILVRDVRARIPYL